MGHSSDSLRVSCQADDFRILLQYVNLPQNPLDLVWRPAAILWPRQVFFTNPAASVQLSVKVNLVWVHICYISSKEIFRDSAKGNGGANTELKGNKGHSEQIKAAPTKQLPHIQPTLLPLRRQGHSCLLLSENRENTWTVLVMEGS